MIKRKVDNETRFWLYNTYGKADHCEHCELPNKKRYCWTIKKKHKMIKNRTHYLQLCFSCVQKYHEGVKTKWREDTEYRKKCVRAGQRKIFTPEHRKRLTAGHIKANGMQIHFVKKRYLRNKVYFKPNLSAKEYLKKVLGNA